jgi:hypothetical protein
MEDFAIAQEIEKDTIKGYLICFQDHNTYATVVQVKTPMYETVTNKIAPQREVMQFIST